MNECDATFDVYPSTSFERGLDVSDYSVWRDDGFELSFRRIFQKAVTNWNLFQPQSKRIKDFYADILNDPKAYVGCSIDIGIYSKNIENSRNALKRYIKAFEGRNSKMQLVSAYCLESDECSRLTIDFIPIGTGYKKGPAMKPGFSRAIDEEGYKFIPDQPTPKDRWLDDEAKSFNRILKEEGFEPNLASRFVAIDFPQKESNLPAQISIADTQNLTTDKETEYYFALVSCAEKFLEHPEILSKSELEKVSKFYSDYMKTSRSFLKDKKLEDEYRKYRDGK